MTHDKFIAQPVGDIVKNVISFTNSLKNDIGAHPINEYIMESVLLRMTGFLEQKAKCIVWELATDDFDYRFNKFKSALPTYSSYDEKNDVYKDLFSQIAKYQEILYDEYRNQKIKWLLCAARYVKIICAGTAIANWNIQQYNDIDSIIQKLHTNCFTENNSNNLFGKKQQQNYLVTAYDALYRHRNRCAHNTKSYQPNLPTFAHMNNESNQYNNYFIYFILLILIDKIYRNLFNKYRSYMCICNHSV